MCGLWFTHQCLGACQHLADITLGASDGVGASVETRVVTMWAELLLLALLRQPDPASSPIAHQQWQ
jgi:hypothetical protein